MNEQLSQTDLLKAVLLSFKIQTYDFQELRGTNVTLYKFRPMLGMRISRITGIKNEIAAALRVPSVRIIAPMEDGSVGIEIPNKQRPVVPVDSLFESEAYKQTSMTLPCCLGLTVTNDVFMTDLAEMPHLLVAGATGQGKSVGLNVILMSLMHRLSPDELKFVLIDPKQVEFSIYENYPSAYFANLGLNDNICTDTESAEQTLNAVCKLMEQRYSLLRSVNVRNIQEYNNHRSVLGGSATKKLPYVVVVIDEYCDLVMTGGRDIEKSICRIAQKARAVGIHMIISTQRPSATIVTGNIKANFPVRIAFRTTTGTDSRVILDRMGAEKLTGRGDMLFAMGADTTRVQCAYVDTDYIYNFRDELSSKYENTENLSLFIETEKEESQRRSIVLTAPIHPDTEKAALLICKLEEVSEGIINSYCYGYYCNNYIKMYGKEILQNLRDLYICTPEYNQWGQKKPLDRVLIHDPEQIKAVISQYR